MHDYFHLRGGSKVPAAQRRALMRAVLLGEDYRRRRKGGAAPERTLGREVRLPEDWGRAVESALDLTFPSQRAGEALTSRFGPVLGDDGAYGVLALLARDMALHPRAWEGVDVAALVEELGPAARAVYLDALKGG